MRRDKLEIARDIILTCPKPITYLTFCGGRCTSYRDTSKTVKWLLRVDYLRARPATPSDGYQPRVKTIYEATPEGLEYAKLINQAYKGMGDKNA